MDPNSQGIPSPLQTGDILLTPQQMKERQQQKVKAFVDGLKKLEAETGMGIRVSLQFTPEGIFPGGRIMELKPEQLNAGPVPKNEAVKDPTPSSPTDKPKI